MTGEARQTALVTGATGTLGPSLVMALLQAGYEVSVLTRGRGASGVLPESVTLFTGDITDPAVVNQAAAGCDVIFHLAAKLHVSNPASSLRKEYESVNVHGTRNIVAAAQANSARRLIFFSTISVYGPTNSVAIYDEQTPLAPRTLYAQTKRAAEEIALAARNAAGDDLTVVLRLAAVYGPGMKGNYHRLLQALEKGFFLPVGQGTNRRTLVYVDDAIRAAMFAARAAHPGTTYNVTDGEIHSLREILAAMSYAVERRPPRFYVPATPLRRVLRLTDRGFALVSRQPPISEATLDKLLEDVAVSGNQIRQDLGFEPQVNLVRGWQKTAAEKRRK